MRFHCAGQPKRHFPHDETRPNIDLATATLCIYMHTHHLQSLSIACYSYVSLQALEAAPVVVAAPTHLGLPPDPSDLQRHSTSQAAPRVVRRHRRARRHVLPARRLQHLATCELKGEAVSMTSLEDPPDKNWWERPWKSAQNHPTEALFCSPRGVRQGGIEEGDASARVGLQLLA